MTSDRTWMPSTEGSVQPSNFNSAAAFTSSIEIQEMRMNVIEVFLPLDTGRGEPVPPEVIEGLVAGLADRFGGATAYTREPAQGLWKRATTMERDRIIVVEVMVEEVHETWWRDYRTRLESEFEQERILIRVTGCQTL